MVKKIYPITLSLAGICQSVYLIQTLAYSGKYDIHAFKTCFISILKINPISTIQIYRNHEKNLNIGLKNLISILSFSNFIIYIFNTLNIYLISMIIEKNK